MKLVKVIKNGQVVQLAKFDNDADMNAWIQMLADTGAWGKPQRWLADTPISPLSEEEKAKAKKKRKVEVMGEEVEEYFFEADYEIDVKDITAEIEAEKQVKEAKKLAKEKRKADRKAIDWSKNLTTKQLQEIVKAQQEAIEALED